MDFLKRHRRKFVGTGVFLTGGYALYRFLKYKIQQHAELRLEEMIEQSRKTSHFLSNQETCLQTVVSFLPNLQILIARCFDSQQLRSSLDENPTKKLEIWRDLMLTSVCRCMASIYSLPLLYIFVRVQVNILAAQMYRTQHADTNSDDEAGQELRRAYLSELKYFLTDGLKTLFAIIERVVRQHVKNISLKDQFSVLDMKAFFFSIKNDLDFQLDAEVALNEDKSACFTHILLPNITSQTGATLPAISRASLETESESDTSLDKKASLAAQKFPSFTNCVLSYMESKRTTVQKVFRLSSSKANGASLNLKALLLQTRDILDMQDFSTTVMDLTNKSVLFCISLLASNNSVTASQSPHQVNFPEEEGPDECASRMAMPMAKWVPVLDSQLYCLCRFDDQSNCLLLHLHFDKTVKNFSENIYEAFLNFDDGS